MTSAPGTGPASRGSRLQLQLYVNNHTQLLDSAIVEQIPELAGVQIEWRSPLAESKPDMFHEMRDGEFLRALVKALPRLFGDCNRRQTPLGNYGSSLDRR